MSRFKIELMLILVIIFWGGNFTFSKWAMLQLSPELLTLYRFSIVFPVLLLGTYLMERSVHIHRKDWARLIFTGFVGIALYQTLFMSSIKYTSSMNASLINALAPIFTGFLAVLSGQERFTWRVQIGTILAFFGASIIILSGSQSTVSATYPNHLYGDLVGILAAFAFGAYPILVTPLLLHYSSMRITAWSSGIAVLFLLLLNFPVLFSGIPLDLSKLTWAGIIYAAIPVTVYGLVAWYYGVSKIGPTSVMVYMYALPFVSACISYFSLGERIYFEQIIGGIIILIGISIVKMKGGNKPAYSRA